MAEKMYGDTNIAIRLLVGDKDIAKNENDAKAKMMVRETIAIAEKVSRGELVLEFIDSVIIEMTYVLDKYYGVERAEASRLILGLLEADGVESSIIMKMALQIYPTVNLDIVDIQLAVLSQQNRIPILSWDRGYKHLDCENKTPGDLNHSE